MIRTKNAQKSHNSGLILVMQAFTFIAVVSLKHSGILYIMIRPLSAYIPVRHGHILIAVRFCFLEF
jgi:hypothetical protein